MEQRKAAEERPVERNPEGRDDLEGGERHRDPEQEPPSQAFAEALRQAMLRVCHGCRRRRFHALQFAFAHLISSTPFAPIIRKSREGRTPSRLSIRSLSDQDPCFVMPFSLRKRS